MISPEASSGIPPVASSRVPAEVTPEISFGRLQDIPYIVPTVIPPATL